MMSEIRSKRNSVEQDKVGTQSNITHSDRVTKVYFQIIHLSVLGADLAWTLLSLIPGKNSHVCINSDYRYF